MNAQMKKTLLQGRLTGKLLLIIMMAALALAFGSAKASAASEVPLTKATFPSTVTLKVGETKTLKVSTAPANTTYKTNIEWGSQTNGKFTVDTNGFGTYWGQPSSEKLTGKSVGTGYLNTTVKVYNSKGKGVRTYEFSTMVKVVSGTAKSAGTSKAKKTLAQNGKYRNVSTAYTAFNRFRTSRANQWYWNRSNSAKVRAYGLKSLRRDAALEKTAKLRAKEQWTMYYSRGEKTHTRPNGKDAFTAFPSNVYYRGENLGWGQTSGQEIISDWAETGCRYKNQGHRRIMLDRKFTKVGIACYEKNGRTCWAMCLGR